MQNEIDNNEIQLTEKDKENLKKQNSRIVPEHKANILDKCAQKYWDLFYKRNETRFFKDRHWTLHEFHELLKLSADKNDTRKVLFEVGCGVGNFIFPLIEENMDIFILACDFSPRAVELVKNNKLYNSDKIKAFQCDITTDTVLQEVEQNSVDVITLIFVLSAVNPQKYVEILARLYLLLKPGGIVFFRDYGLYDRAQIRFKPGHKISENFYMRQDGTRSYYFSTETTLNVFRDAGYEIIDCDYVHRRTTNVKEQIDVPRIFIQSKVMKPR